MRHITPSTLHGINLAKLMKFSVSLNSYSYSYIRWTSTPKVPCARDTRPPDPSEKHANDFTFRLPPVSVISLTSHIPSSQSRLSSSIDQLTRFNWHLPSRSLVTPLSTHDDAAHDPAELDESPRPPDGPAPSCPRHLQPDAGEYREAVGDHATAGAGRSVDVVEGPHEGQLDRDDASGEESWCVDDPPLMSWTAPILCRSVLLRSEDENWSRADGVNSLLHRFRSTRSPSPGSAGRGLEGRWVHVPWSRHQLGGIHGDPLVRRPGTAHNEPRVGGSYE
jgi:hypothetical protein